MAPLSRVLISTQTCIINGLGAGYGQCSNGLEVQVICKVFLVANIYLRYIRFQTLNIGNIIVSLLNTLQPSHMWNQLNGFQIWMIYICKVLFHLTVSCWQHWLGIKINYRINVLLFVTSFVASQNDHDLIMIMYRINVLLLVTSLVASQNALEAPSLLNLMMMEANMIPMASRNRRGWAFNARCHEKALTLGWQWYLMSMIKKENFGIYSDLYLKFDFLREPLMLNWASTIKKSKCGTLNVCTIYCGNVTFPLFYQVLFKCHRYADTF